MPRYQIDLNGQKFEMEAPDDNALSVAVKQLQATNGAPAGPSNDDALSVARTGVGGFIEGIPVVGPYIRRGTEKAAAATISAFSDRTYDDVLKQIDQANAGEKAANPWVDTGAQIAGGVAGTVPMVMAAPGAFGIGSGPMALKAGASMLSGAAIGGADSAVRSEGDLTQTGLGLGIGAIAGTAAPVLGRAVGSGIRYLRSAGDDALSGMSRGASRYLETELADSAKISQQRAALDRLGPEATLADVSPEWLGVARGAAARPGTRDRIVQALTQRQDAANARLGGDLNANLGAAPIPSQIERGIEGSLDDVARNYGPVMGEARAVDTRPLAENLEAMVANTRGPEQQAIRQVRGYLNIPGANELDPNPQALLATRQAIDGLLTNEANPQVIRQLTMARQNVDGLLADAAPGLKSVDAQYSELARQRTALGQGRPILNNEASALRPSEVQEMLADGALPQGEQVGPSAVPTRMRQGVRAEIDRAIGTKANDTTAVRNIVRGEGDWNRDKLGMLFGQENADRALSAIDRETVFGDTANRVTRGSDTAMGSRFAKFLDGTESGGNVPSDITLTGIGLRGAKKVAEALLQRNAERAAGRYADDIGMLSVAQGAQRDAIIEALTRRGADVQAASDPRMQAVVNALMQSAAQRSRSR